MLAEKLADKLDRLFKEADQFEQWTDNILTAQTLEQMFECSRE